MAMKVKELIAELLKHDQDLEVYLQGFNADDGGTGEVGVVYTSLDNDVTIREKRHWE